jgi:hypothetical protein
MSRLRNTRLSRNDLCWCESGKKYKNCHLDRTRAKPLQVGQIRDLHDRPFIENKVCLHSEAPQGCGKVIRAHTLQRSGIVRRLTGKDNHVLSFYPFNPTEGGILRPHRVGWRQASTFRGFCQPHDGRLFSAIETEPFVGSQRQILLVGYRALCHEIYQKQAAEDAHNVFMENLDRGLPEADQRSIQSLLAANSAGRRAGLQEARALKGLYDDILGSGDYSLLHSAVLSFRGTPSVASTGAVHVDFDLRGKRLQNLDSDAGPIQATTFGVLSTSEGCAFVAVWPAGHSKCDDFIRSLLSYESEGLTSLLTEFFFAYVENTYFSEAWWSSLPVSNQERLTSLAGTMVQYGKPLRYSGLRHVSWELERTDIKLD